MVLTYRIIQARAALARALWHLSRRIMPDGHCNGVYRNTPEAMRQDLAAYGARLGIVEPLFHKTMQARTVIETVWQDLRAAKMYAQADQLRKALGLMDSAASYAFPKRYKEKP